MKWKCRNRILDTDSRPLVMGILNVTPDSFSDGGQHFDRAAAADFALQMVDDGADIIDVGGESTRPGAAAVSEAEELDRVVPVIAELRKSSDAAISVDTSKAAVARAAVAAGADIINDVTAFTNDPAMVDVAAESGAGVVLMHMQGNPRTMQDSPDYPDVVEDVKGYLRARAESLFERGIAPESVSVDPGIGFGKNLEHNLKLLAGLKALTQLNMPVIVGLSRKSFLGKITGREVDERLSGSIAALAYCVGQGVDVMRVHDVRESADAIRVLKAIEGAV